jgi:hypothetical protein
MGIERGLGCNTQRNIGKSESYEAWSRPTTGPQQHCGLANRAIAGCHVSGSNIFGTGWRGARGFSGVRARGKFGNADRVIAFEPKRGKPVSTLFVQTELSN